MLSMRQNGGARSSIARAGFVLLAALICVLALAAGPPARRTCSRSRCRRPGRGCRTSSPAPTGRCGSTSRTGSRSVGSRPPAWSPSSRSRARPTAPTATGRRRSSPAAATCGRWPTSARRSTRSQPPAWSRSCTPTSTSRRRTSRPTAPAASGRRAWPAPAAGRCPADCSASILRPARSATTAIHSSAVSFSRCRSSPGPTAPPGLPTEAPRSGRSTTPARSPRSRSTDRARWS